MIDISSILKSGENKEIDLILKNHLEELLKVQKNDESDDMVLATKNENIVLWDEIGKLESIKKEVIALRDVNQRLKQSIVEYETFPVQQHTNLTQSECLKVLCLCSNLQCDMSVKEALELAQFFASKHLVILPSAWKSTQEIPCEFSDGVRVFKLIARLVASYVDKSFSGKDPSQFFTPNEYSAFESETTKNSIEAMRSRTFYYKGRELLMNSHLKIGVSRDKKKTLRIHFAFDKEEDAIVIGWCGEHLPLI